MVEKLLDALCRGDYLGMAALFSRDCRYFDYCPLLNGKQGYFVYGREAVEMFFRNRFVQGRFEAASPVAEDERTGSYFGAYEGPFVFARLRIEELDEDGLIRKLTVCPA